MLRLRKAEPVVEAERAVLVSDRVWEVGGRVALHGGGTWLVSLGVDGWLVASEEVVATPPLTYVDVRGKVISSGEPTPEVRAVPVVVKVRDTLPTLGFWP